MAGKARLQIEVVGDADDAVSSFDRVTSSARDMGNTVDRASTQADQSADRLSNTADAADNMASSSSQAAGGLGDLGGALSLLPGPLGAMGAGMEAAAPAIMGVTGASDLLSLAMNSTVVTTARARAASIAHAVTSKAQTVATYATAVAQRVLNAALRANPIGLVITAVTLLVAGIVLLYKRSETARRIVDAAFRVIQRAASAAYNWIRDNWKNILTILTGPIGIAVRVIGGNWNAIKDGAVTAFTRIRDFVQGVIDKVKSAADTVKSKFSAVWTGVKTAATTAFDAIMAPINAVIEKVEWLLDKLDSVPGLGGLLGRASVGGTTSAPSGGGDVVNIQLPLLSLLDESAIAQLIAALTEFYRRRGLKVQLVPA